MIYNQLNSKITNATTKGQGNFNEEINNNEKYKKN